MVILPNDRVLLLTQERIKTMSDTKISLNNEAARIKQIIEEKEKKRNFTEPAAIPSFDREIRQLKRQLDELNKNLWLVRKSIQNIGEANGDTDVRIKGQKITCNLPDLSKVMSMDEEARLMSTVFFRRGEML